MVKTIVKKDTKILTSDLSACYVVNKNRILREMNLATVVTAEAITAVGLPKATEDPTSIDQKRVATLIDNIHPT